MVEENNDNARKMMNWFILRINYRAVLLSHKLEEIGARKDKTEEEREQTQQQLDECRLEMLYLKGRADAIWKDKTIEELVALKDEWGNKLLVKFIDDIIEEKAKGKSQPSADEQYTISNRDPDAKRTNKAVGARLGKMKIVTGILIVTVIILIVGFIPLKEIAHTSQEFLTYKVTGYTKEEQVDPELQRLILSTVAFSKNQEEINNALKQAYQKYIVAYVQVENTDKEAGAFPLAVIFYTPKGEDRKVFDIYLKPSETKEVKYGIEAPDGEWSVKTLVIPDLKTVTTTEKVTFLEYLLSRD